MVHEYTKLHDLKASEAVYAEAGLALQSSLIEPWTARGRWVTH